MIQTLMGGRKTVAGVLAAFNKTLDDLKVVEQQNEAEAIRQAQAIEQARAAHNAAVAEAAMAREVAEKLTNLVSPVIGEITVGELKAECA